MRFINKFMCQTEDFSEQFGDLALLVNLDLDKEISMPELTIVFATSFLQVMHVFK